MIDNLNLSPTIGAIEQQQPMIPQVMPMQAAPQMMMPGYSPYMMPQAAFPQDIQEKTLDNLRMRLNEGLDDRKGKYEDVANKIFTGLVAPAFATFGGPGTSAGAVQAMNAAKAEGQQAKQNRMVEAQQKQAAIKGYVDMYNTVGIKPLQKLVEDQLKARKQDADMSKTQATLAQRDRALGLKEKVATNTQTYHDQILKLKSRGLDISEDKLKQTKELAEKKMQHADAYARLMIEQQKYGYDAARQRQMDQIKHQFATEQQQLAKFNSEMEVKLQEKDVKTGKYKYTDEQGNPLDPSRYQLQIDAPKVSEPVSDEGLMSALEALHASTQSGGQPQMMQQGQALPQAGAMPQMHPQALQRGVSVFQGLIKQGVQPDQAAKMFIQSATTKGGMSLQQAMQLVQSFSNGQQ